MGYDQRPATNDREPDFLDGLPSAREKLICEGSLEAQGLLFEAIASAQGDFRPIFNETEGQIGNRRFRYASLDQLKAATKDALKANKIGVLQIMHGPNMEGNHTVTTIVAGHGAKIRSDVDYQRAKDVKGWGMQTTYIRRYTFRALFQLDGSDDADSIGENAPMGAPMGKTQAAPPAADKPKPSPKQETPATQRAQQPSPNPQQGQEQASRQGAQVAGQLGLQASGQQTAATLPAPEPKPAPTPAPEPVKPASVPPPPVPHDQETGEVDGPITKATLEAMRAATKAAKGPDGIAARFSGKDEISQWVLATFSVMPSQITELIGRQIILRLSEGT